MEQDGRVLVQYPDLDHLGQRKYEMSHYLREGQHRAAVIRTPTNAEVYVLVCRKNIYEYRCRKWLRQPIGAAAYFRRYILTA